MPEGGEVAAHRVFSLANKFVATTASLFAAAVGFAALAVSKIRPIREMGLWVAAGLLITWVVVFTPLPGAAGAPQGPGDGAAHDERAGASTRSSTRLPGWTYRRRWPLLAGSVLLMLAGAAALFGLPGRLEPMRLETDALAYVDPREPVARDTRASSGRSAGWSVGGALGDDAPRSGPRTGASARSRPLHAPARGRPPPGLGDRADDRRCASMHYVAGGADTLPDDDAAWAGMAARLEALLLEEPALRDDLDVATLSNARITVVHPGGAFAGVGEMKRYFAGRFEEAAGDDPALAGCRLRVTGSGLLQAKIAQDLVPTLTESFLLTAVIIFAAFLVVFRSGAARPDGDDPLGPSPSLRCSW